MTNDAGGWHTGLGLMSGSSLDGLDIACCRFRIDPGPPIRVGEWEIAAAETLPIPEEWKERLLHLPKASARDLALAHAQLGRLWGRQCREFLSRHPACKPQFIASHGHTIFHWPDQGVSLQIGDGAAIAAETGLPVVCDFRTADIALGGQGAPLAPLADRYLFPGYDAYLNIGGIANISFQKDGRWTAFDTGFANQVFNRLAQEVGLPYDEGGAIAASGALDAELFERANALHFFSHAPPKSLGNDWVLNEALPLFLDKNVPLPNRLRTAVECLAWQTARALREWGPKTISPARVLVTGGGAYNKFLLERLEALHPLQAIVPAPLVVEYKEALLMALMGAFRLAGLPNCLSEATGASADAIGGTVYQPS